MQILAEYLGGEVIGLDGREVTGERLGHHHVGARLAQELGPPFERNDQGGSQRGGQQASRVRIEGQHHRVTSRRIRQPARGGDERLVAAVHAVEVSNRHGGAGQGPTEGRRQILATVNQQHSPQSTSSKASNAPAGPAGHFDRVRHEGRGHDRRFIQGR